MNNPIYNWFAGNQCYPKCKTEKVNACREKIDELLLNTTINSRRELVESIRAKNKICTLSAAEFARFVYGEPLCKHSKPMDKKETKRMEILKDLTLLLVWLTRFSENRGIDGEPVWRAWRGYDFDVLRELLKEDKISYSYTSKSILLKDKGIKVAEKLIKKYNLENNY